MLTITSKNNQDVLISLEDVEERVGVYVGGELVGKFDVWPVIEDGQLTPKIQFVLRDLKESRYLKEFVATKNGYMIVTEGNEYADE